MKRVMSASMVFALSWLLLLPLLAGEGNAYAMSLQANGLVGQAAESAGVGVALIRSPRAGTTTTDQGKMDVTFSGEANGQLQATASSEVRCTHNSSDAQGDVFGVRYDGVLHGSHFLLSIGSPSTNPGTYTPGEADVSILGPGGNTSGSWEAIQSGTITIITGAQPGSGTFDIPLADGQYAPLHISGRYVCGQSS